MLFIITSSARLLSSHGDRAASHQSPASQKRLNSVPSPAVTGAPSGSMSTRTSSQEFRRAEQQLWWCLLSSQVFLFMVAPGCSWTPWPFESVLVLAKPFFVTMGIFLQALERNGALCLPTVDDQMAFLFPILQQSLEAFSKQTPLFSTPSPLTSLLTEILRWRQNCQWWSLRCTSETALPTRAWSSSSAVWVCKYSKSKFLLILWQEM